MEAFSNNHPFEIYIARYFYLNSLKPLCNIGKKHFPNIFRLIEGINPNVNAKYHFHAPNLHIPNTFVIWDQYSKG